MPKISDIKKVWVGDRPVKRIWYEGKIIWPTYSELIRGFEGPVCELKKNLSSGSVLVPASPYGVGAPYNITEAWWNDAGIWTILEVGGDVTLKQGAREVFKISRDSTGYEVTSVSEKGVFLRARVDSTKTGMVYATISKDWYGYKIWIEIIHPGNKKTGPAQQSNGGGFTKGETAFTQGAVNVEYRGCHFYAFRVGKWRWPGDLSQDYCFENNASVSTVQVTGHWRAEPEYPTANMDVYIISGGQGGAGGTSENSGDSGKDGAFLKLPSGVSSGYLTVGSGGAGGNWNTYWGDRRGKTGEPTTLDGYSSPIEGSTRLPYRGDIGVGGGAGDVRGRGYQGKPGGLVVIFFWEIPK